MSTDASGTRGAARRRRARSLFARSLALVVAGLVVVGAAGAAYSLTQGPRVSTVVVDTVAASAAAGQRLVFTTN